MKLPAVRPEVAALPAYQPVQPLHVRARQLGLRPADLVKLDANENPYGPLPAVRQALAGLEGLHIYPDPARRRLRAALAAWLDVPAERILAGAGADELIDLTLRLLLPPGEAALTCPPTFSMYAFGARLNGGRVVAVPRRADFSLDLDGIRRAVAREKPRLLFLASPNNPDGGLLSQAELDALLDLPLYLVLDEAYVEFAPAGSSRARQVLQRPNLIVLRTFSKWGGLAGLRVGYGLFPSALMPHLWKLKPPYNLNAAAETAALVTLQRLDEQRRRTEAILAERERLSAALRAFPWLHPLPSQANFILCRVSGRRAADLYRQLMARGILIRYFNKPGLRDAIRISVGRPEDTDRLLQALEDIARQPAPRQGERP